MSGKHVRGSLRWLAPPCALIAATVGCAGRAAPTATEIAPAAGGLTEESLEPRENPRVEIIELREADDAAEGRVTLVGTIVNQGGRATRELNVKVLALDDAERVLASVAAVPSTQRLEPRGGTATFAATLSASPRIRGYKVEAFAF